MYIVREIVYDKKCNEIITLYARTVHVFYVYSLVHGKAFSGSFFGKGSGPIALSGIRCNGNEVDLLNCREEKSGDAVCEHSQDAGVSCSCRYKFILPARHIYSTQYKMLKNHIRSLHRLRPIYVVSWGFPFYSIKLLNMWLVIRVFLRTFSLKQCTETSWHKATHPLLQNWLLSNTVLMDYNISLTYNFWMIILCGKVIEIENLFYLPMKLALVDWNWLPLST